MQAEEIRLAARGLAMAGLRWQRGAPQRVLCVHGWLDNAASFALLAPQLDGCDVVSLDLPGHGRSAHRGAGIMQHIVEYVADVVGALDALGWDDAVLLGHSMGAAVMTGVAAVCPQRVRALLLIDGLVPQYGEDARLVASLGAAIEAGLRRTGESAGYPDMAAAVVARGKGFWPLSDEAAALILARALTPDDEGVLRWHTDPRLRHPSAVRLTHGQVKALLAAVRAPALLLGARRALFADPAAYEELLSLMPGLRVEVVDAGHHMQLEPEALPVVLGLVRDFLAGVAAKG